MSNKKEIIDLVKKGIEQQKTSDIETRKLIVQQMNTQNYCYQDLKKILVERNMLEAQRNIMDIIAHLNLSSKSKITNLKACKLYVSKYEAESPLAKKLVELITEYIADMREEMEQD